MDLEDLLGFTVVTEDEERVFTSFTSANVEYFRRCAMKEVFKAGQVEPNYDYPHMQAIEIARAQARKDVYLELIELAESQMQIKNTQQESAMEQEFSSATFINTSAI